MAGLTVLYHKGTTLDMDHYLKVHIPLVEKLWGPYGMESAKVYKMDDDAAFCAQATLTWGSLDQIKKALAAPATKEIQDDVKKFADKEPIFIFGETLVSTGQEGAKSKI
ncbi:hypothetical protein K470DRAFT_255106 [Piedraia hortae CBS 480.64]|uniref:EthD domain-containing protein n=1 Tax=Piedraia hortae CBS 480.64 TaxID=1314780 RepID=A0A6A7C7J0_9PEZI|nr:hypothetical protein K470DRAFT_255106 [Piedraia hortae CBS 480.64]